MIGLDADEVHVWRASLVQPPEVLQRLACLLSADERERAARYHFERHRSRFVASRAIQRDVLSRYAGLPPGDLVFSYSPTGKPDLAGAAASSGVTFSVSNSGELAVYAVARERAVGVDVEELRPLGDAMAIAERFFGPRAIAAIDGARDDERAAVFLQYWTRLEARVKALGASVGDPLDGVSAPRDVEPGLDTQIITAREATGPLASYALDVGAAYVGALVVGANVPTRIRYFDWSPRSRG